MREIKFRGKIHGRWWYVTPEESGIWGQFWDVADKKTIGQHVATCGYGQEIYIGDIVQNVATGERKVIEFSEGIPAYGCDPFVEVGGGGWQSAGPDELIVVGTIHDDPELMRDK